ncbi:hypothetical protein M885DRAFT_618024 [Pelagophyceae sp. CCMP2097]|nr:hypothetical protein M885DRAFT_618024 [Pelagophyceae sp. CCMP2097]
MDETGAVRWRGGWRGAPGDRSHAPSDAAALGGVSATARAFVVCSPPRSMLGVPVDEWTPQLGYNFEPAPLRSSTFRSGPRSWPDAAAYTTGYRSEASRTDGAGYQTGAPASFVRETTAFDSTFTPSMTLMATSKTQRRSEAELRAAGRNAMRALEEKKHQVAKHADWLAEDARSAQQARWRAEAFEDGVMERAAALGHAPEAPTAYRSAMRRAGAGVAPARNAPRRVGTFAVLTQPSFDEAHALPLRGAATSRAAVVALVDCGARELARYARKSAAVGALCICLETEAKNQRPGHGAAPRRPSENVTVTTASGIRGAEAAFRKRRRILELCAMLRATAGENPDPAVVSRTQFLIVARGTLHGLSDRDANLLFSALEQPRGIDRVRVGAVAAALLAAHRPGANANALTVADRAAARGNASLLDVLPVLRSCEPPRALIYDPEADGIQPDEVRELLSCAATARGDNDKMDALLATQPLFHRLLTGDDLVKALLRCPEIFGEFDRQLSVYRSQVRRSKEAEMQRRVRAKAESKQHDAQIHAHFAKKRPS